MSKKEQIINAAIKIFAEKGLEKGKIADIAKEAGIGKGTVYEYFRSKEDLFNAIEEMLLDQMDHDFDEIITMELAPYDKLETIISQGLDMMLQMDDALLILTELWAQAVRGHWHTGHDSNLVAAYDKFRNKIKQVLHEGIEAGEFREMSKDGVATLLMAFMDGLGWQYMLMKDEVRFQKVKSEAIKSFMRGIKR